MKTTSPHYRMTIKTSLKDGYKFKVENVQDFCQEIGINRSTYFEAVAQLGIDEHPDLYQEIENLIPKAIGGGEN